MYACLSPVFKFSNDLIQVGRLGMALSSPIIVTAYGEYAVKKYSEYFAKQPLPSFSQQVKDFVVENQSKFLVAGAVGTLVACSPLIYKGVKSRLPKDCGEVVKQFIAKFHVKEADKNIN